MKKPISFIFGALLLLGCQSEPAVEGVTVSLEDSLNQDAVQVYDGFDLLNTSCFSCHQPGPDGTDKIAPSWTTIRSVYLELYPDESEFVTVLSDYLANPTVENSRVDGAVDSFGIMPQMGLLADQRNAIANYLYYNEVGTTDWYLNAYPQELERIESVNVNKKPLDQGFEYAMTTKSVLGKNLKGKINSEGALAALNFCNLRAYPLVDSMRNVLGVDIKRVSDRNRNPENKATIHELSVIHSYKNYLLQEEEIPFTYSENDEMFTGYYPIVTNDMCLKCHGTPSNIEPSVQQRIDELYPADKAVGYDINELRGIWVVTFQK